MEGGDRLIVIFRDGVINAGGGSAGGDVERWAPLPGSLEAVARLNHAGYRVVVANREVAIGAGDLNVEALNRIHDKMLRLAAEVGAIIEAVFYCPHRLEEKCGCGKGKGGLLRQMANRLRIELAGLPVIGGCSDDLWAARSVGARTFLVESCSDGKVPADGTFNDLSAVVDALLLEHAVAA